MIIGTDSKIASILKAGVLRKKKGMGKVNLSSAIA